MRDFNRAGWLGRGRLAIVAAVGLLALTYATAHLLGSSTDPLPGAADPPPGPAATSPSPSPSPDPSPEPRDPSQRSAAAGDPAPVAAPRPATATRPFTGPGNPPLITSGAGPHGTHRTTGEDYVALTFDDGPDPRWTPEVLALLRRNEVKATFCVVGQLVEAFPDLVREIVDDGHTICNHTWDHDMSLGSRSRERIRDDLERTDKAIRAAAPGTRISYYRQPGGAWTPRVVAVAEELGMSSLHWQVDPQDWRSPPAPAIATEVTVATEDGAIVLLHDGGGERSGTVQALRRFLPDLAGRHRLDALPPGMDPPRRHGLELPAKPAQL